MAENGSWILNLNQILIAMLAVTQIVYGTYNFLIT
jgi:hypothetical protein